MARQDELNEFMGVLSALMKKYNVSLAVSVNDLDAKPTTDLKEGEVL